MIYKEYSKKKLIKNIEFGDYNYILLLTLLQEKVYSFNELKEEIKISGEDLICILSELYMEGLIYYSTDYNNITTVIVTN